MQLLFLIFTVFSVLLLVPFTYYGYHHCMSNYINAPKDYNYPTITDLKHILWLSVIIQAFFEIIGRFAKNLFVPYVKGQENQLEVEMRSTKAGN